MLETQRRWSRFYFEKLHRQSEADKLAGAKQRTACVCHLPSRSIILGYKLGLSENAKENEYGGSDGKVDGDRYHKAREALRHVVDSVCACGTAAPQKCHVIDTCVAWCNGKLPCSTQLATIAVREAGNKVNDVLNRHRLRPRAEHAQTH